LLKGVDFANEWSDVHPTYAHIDRLLPT